MKIIRGKLWIGGNDGHLFFFWDELYCKLIDYVEDQQETTWLEFIWWYWWQFVIIGMLLIYLFGNL